MTFSTTQIYDFVSKMILSPSGWRCVFAVSGNENDASTKISDVAKIVCRLIAYSFAKWLPQNLSPKNENGKNGKSFTIVFGTDTRPTKNEIACNMIGVLKECGIVVNYVGVAAAPEIMAYAKNFDGFVYVSASHNPIGHNGIKFGLNDGGVIDGEKAKSLIEFFKTNCADQKLIDFLCDYVCDDEVPCKKAKQNCLKFYLDFSKSVIAASDEKIVQNFVFSAISSELQKNPIAIACDLNGSARCLSIDNTIFAQNGISYFKMNDKAGKIAHAIIPEGENLLFLANFMEQLQGAGNSAVKLGFMCDLDGDRGNIVYWNGEKAEILSAQEVFALSTLAELSYMDFLAQKFPAYKAEKNAVCVNGPTSMRIEEIAQCFGSQVFRSEVGEANVVNLARSVRLQGYRVRILGEGSNGGTITYPSSVRDPINTIFALLKLLCIKDEVLPNGNVCFGLFHRWCVYSNQSYSADFSLQNIVATLPHYTTTGVSEKRAMLHIKTADHAKLKSAYQKNFLRAWQSDKNNFFAEHGIVCWRAFSTNGTTQTADVSDFAVSIRGGLKIVFYDEKNCAVAFIWMRGSGTEPVFRIICDVKGDDDEFEAQLLAWHSRLLEKSDSMC